MKADLPAPQLLIDVRDLSIRFAQANGGQPLVRGVDLSIRAGECVALVGIADLFLDGESRQLRDIVEKRPELACIDLFSVDLFSH